MTTDAFIDLLERRRLVPSNVLKKLRAKVEEGDHRLSPESVLKYLVKKELLTRAQAKELLETTIAVSDKAESSILGLAPLAGLDDVLSQPGPASAPNPPADDVFEVRLPAAESSRSAPLDDLFSPAPAAAMEEIIPLDPMEEDRVRSGPRAPGGRLRTSETKRKPSGLGKKPKSLKTLGKSEWDTPLILLGGAGLAALVVISVILWFLVFRESADALLKQANDAFDRGQYGAAHDFYETFVEKNSSHQHYSHAKVRLATSPMWEAAENRDFAGAAKMAPEVVSQIEDEPAFISYGDDKEGLSSAKRELSTLLTMVAVGLAEQAESATSDEVVKERVASLKQMLELTSNAKYVPQKLRNDGQLNSVRETLKRVELREQREQALAASLASMEDAIKRGEPAAALAVRAKLLTDYPMLQDDESLQKKVVEISVAEKSSIHFTAEPRKAETDAPSTPVVAELAVADRRGAGSEAQGAVPLQIDGAVYGMNLADGSLLWRRFVGQGSDARPLLLADGRAVVVDSQLGELSCFNSQTGKLAWRLPLEGRLATPISAGERILVSSEAGRIYVIDAATGALAGHVDFSQPIRLPPTISENGRLIYALGEHSNLYTLSAEDFSCRGVYYLGHQPSEIVTPTVVALDKIIVAQNSGAETSQIRVLAFDKDGLPAKEVTSHRLNGLVLSSMQAVGRRLAAVTSFGQVVVFELGAGSEKGTFNLLASRDAQSNEPVAHFATLHGGHLWVAGPQLLKLVILPTGNQLSVQSLERDFLGDSFDYPFVVAGEQLIHVRRRPRLPGVVAAAADAEGRTLWETELAATPAGSAVVDEAGTHITAGSGTGAVYLLDREAMTRRVQNSAARASEAPAEPTAFTHGLGLRQGDLLLSAVGSPEIVHYRPAESGPTVETIKLLSPLRCPLVSWRDGFVSASEAGQVTLHNLADGASLAAPFQPELRPGGLHTWLRPAAASVGSESLLVVSDGKERIYALTLKSDAQPALTSTATANVGGSPLITPLAAVAAQVFAGNEAGRLVRFQLPELTEQPPTEVGGRVLWGPCATPTGVLIATDADEMLLVGGDGTVTWRQPLKQGPPGGEPLIDQGAAFILFPELGVARINLADGAESGLAPLGQPAIAGPIAFGPRLVVSAPDGTLLVVNRP